MFEAKRRAKALLLALGRCPASARAAQGISRSEEEINQLQARLERQVVHINLCQEGVLGEALMLLRSASTCSIPVSVRLRLLGVIVERISPDKAMPFASDVSRLAVIEREAKFNQLFFGCNPSSTAAPRLR